MSGAPAATAARPAPGIYLFHRRSSQVERKYRRLAALRWRKTRRKGAMMMPALSRWVAALFLALAASAPPKAATIVIDPSDDAYLHTCDVCNPKVQITSNDAVVVAGFLQGAIKFPKPSLPGSIARARLSVNPLAFPLWNPKIDVYGFESDSSVIDQASADAGTFLGTWTLPPDLDFGTDAYFDVTAFVANATGPYIGFNLRNSGGVDAFSSLEYNYGHPSQLLVTTFEDFCDSTQYDNANPQTSGLFTDLRRAAEISADYANCVLNLTGSAGAGGDMWITVAGRPGGSAPAFGCVQLAAEVNIHRFNNSKAVGFVTHFDPVSRKGLFFGLYDAGSSDALTLSTFDATTGKLTRTLHSAYLGPMIQENAWYSLEFLICSVETTQGAYLYSSGRVSGNNASGHFEFDAPQPAGISLSGQIGIAGQAKNSFVDSSVRAFEWEVLNP